MPRTGRDRAAHDSSICNIVAFCNADAGVAPVVVPAVRLGSAAADPAPPAGAAPGSGSTGHLRVGSSARARPAAAAAPSSMARAVFCSARGGGQMQGRSVVAVTVLERLWGAVSLRSLPGLV